MITFNLLPEELTAMTSLELAAFTYRDHYIILRGIQLMRENLGQLFQLKTCPGIVATTYGGPNGTSFPSYSLDKTMAATLLMGYDRAFMAEVARYVEERDALAANPGLDLDEIRANALAAAEAAESEALKAYTVESAALFTQVYEKMRNTGFGHSAATADANHAVSNHRRNYRAKRSVEARAAKESNLNKYQKAYELAKRL